MPRILLICRGMCCQTLISIIIFRLRDSISFLAWISASPPTFPPPSLSLHSLHAKGLLISNIRHGGSEAILSVSKKLSQTDWYVSTFPFNREIIKLKFVKNGNILGMKLKTRLRNYSVDPAASVLSGPRSE
jgi:hypothetical protein